MITPFMLLLSCLTDKYTYGKPIDAMDMGKQDRDLVITEACRLGELVSSQDAIFHTDSPTGLSQVDDTQLCIGKLRSISPYTALLLTRLEYCYDVFKREQASEAEEEEDDLSTDAVVLRIEGNPKYAYAFVCTLMETPSMDYSSKIKKIKELVNVLLGHTPETQGASEDSETNRILRMQSKLSYWKGMLMSDYIKYYGMLPPVFDAGTIKVIRKELSELGFYGFVNPDDMSMEFRSARISRKTEVDIDPDIMLYLQNVVRSGGE